jgi:hypothetical protein
MMWKWHSSAPYKDRSFLQQLNLQILLNDSQAFVQTWTNSWIYHGNKKTKVEIEEKREHLRYGFIEEMLDGVGIKEVCLLWILCGAIARHFPPICSHFTLFLFNWIGELGTWVVASLGFLSSLDEITIKLREDRVDVYLQCLKRTGQSGKWDLFHRTLTISFQVIYEYCAFRQWKKKYVIY